MKLSPHFIPQAALALSILLSGCAADREAGRIAIHTAQNIAAYDQVVSQKVAAEKAFYQQQLGTLREILGGVSDITEPMTTPEAAAKEKLQRTLSYGRIITTAQRDARIAADRIIVSAKPTGMEQLVTYIDKGVAQEQADLLDFIKRQRSLANDFRASLVPIKQQQEELKALRTSLTQLAAKPTLFDQLKLAIDFGQAVKKELENKK
jgi:hypothetical protein